MKRFLKISIITCSILICCLSTVYAHSGRTDSSGGHRDNKNASGLGGYHYHCGGYPAHLHNNGVCPYDSLDVISISNTPDSLKIGGKIKLDYNISSSKSYINKTWTSSDSSIVSVDNDGMLTANNIGGATITVTTYNNSSSFYVSVLPIEVNSLKLSQDNIEIQLDEMKKVDVTIEPSNSTDKTLSWKSENSNIVSVNNTGEIKGLSVGETNVLVTSSNGVEAHVLVKVYEVFPEAIETEINDLKIEITETLKVKSNIYPDNANNKKISYESENQKVVTLNEEGELQPVDIGKTNIKLTTSNNITKIIPVEIFEINAESINIEKVSNNFIIWNLIDINEKFSLDGIISPNDATYKELTWESSDEDVVSIANGGEFITHNEGTAIIKATNLEGVESDIKINVIDKDKATLIVGLGGGSSFFLSVVTIYIKKKKR